MDIFLFIRNKNIDIKDQYDRVVINQIWDYSKFYKIRTLQEITPETQIENSLSIIERNDLFDISLEPIATALKNCQHKKIIVLYHYKTLGTSLAQKGLANDKHILLDVLGYQPQNIMYITQLKSDIQAVKTNIHPDIKATYFDKWLEELNRYQIKPSYMSKKNHFVKNNFRPDKKFALCIRRYEDVRFEIICELISKNLLDDFHYTFAARGGHEINDIGSSIANYLNNLPKRYMPHHEKILQWAKGIPYEADPIKPGQVEIYDQLYTMDIGNYYNHCKLIVVAETHFHCTEAIRSDFSIITEKVYKAMFYKKPFILLSQPNTLQVLRDCGYKTFGHVIDESYDQIEAVPERLNAISSELLRIRNLDENSLQHLIDSCKEVVEYNYNLMIQESFRTIPKEFSINHFINS
jgi:hypothetical protein